MKGTKSKHALLLILAGSALMLASCGQEAGSGKATEVTPVAESSVTSNAESKGSETPAPASPVASSESKPVASEAKSEQKSETSSTPAAESEKEPEETTPVASEGETQGSSEEHVHTFDTETWDHDETNHWHNATCGHDVKGDEAAHTFGDYFVISEPTETEDGVEAKTCTTCDYQVTRAIPRKQFAVNYPFVSTGCYTVTDSTRGVTIDAALDTANGYEAMYLSMSECKVEQATSYSFKIKNNGTDRIEMRVSYRNGSVSPRVYCLSTDASQYTITSQRGSSNTKIREYSSDYIKFNIAGNDTATITMPLVDNCYDQLLFLPIHQTAAVSITIIETGYSTETHNYSETYTYDDNYHWKECQDEGCSFTAEKGSHTFVADTTKEDIPATATETGTKYEVCSVCGKTREVEIPVIGGDTTATVDLLEQGFTSTTYYNVTANDDGTYTIDYTQPASGYQNLPVNNYASLTFTKAEYSVIKVQNLGENAINFCPVFYDLDGNINIASGELVSSLNGSSSFSRVGSSCAYCVLGANDTAEFKINLNATTGFTKLRFMCDPNPSAESTGSFKIMEWYILDRLVEEETPEEEEGESTSTNLANETNVTFVGSSGGMNIEDDTSATLGSGVKCTVTGALTASQRHLIVGLGATYNLETDSSRKISFIMGSNMDIGDKDELQILRFYGTLNGNTRKTSSSTFPMGSTITHTLLETTGGINYYQFSMTFGDFTADGGNDIDGFAIMFRNGGSIGQIAGIYNFVVE